MGSVEFSDSYRTVALGYPTNYVRINYTELEYDSATNRTKIRLDGVYLKSSLNIGSTAVYGTLKIAGTTVLTMSGGSYQCSINTSYNLVSYSGNNAIVWVQHNNDGTASMSVSLTGGKANDDNNNVFGGYVGVMSGKAVFGVRTTATKNVPLTTRPRGSTITSSTANAATNGAFSLVMDRKDSSYYHIATFSYGDDVLFTSAQFDTSLNFTVPRSWFADYPSLASIPVTISVQTHNSGGTAIGSPATANLTVTADADMKPSVSSGWATVVPYNVGGVAGFTGYVKNYSKAEATFDATKIDMTNAVGASIASYSVTCQGETAAASPYRTPTIASTSVSVVCTVTDTRGRTASETFALTVMDYSAPVLTGQTVFRCDSLGVADEDGQYFSVKAVLSYASVGGQNSCSLKCAAAAAGGTYGTETSMTSGTASFIGQYSADTTYTVRIKALDTIGNTAVWTITMPTRKWAMKFRPTGNGVAFGKAAETDNLFEVTPDWAVKFGQPLPMTSGGTGADNAADARDNLGLGSAATEDIVPISEGGTGADNAADARTNLGVDGLQLKSATIDIILSQQTWTTSGAGMYYIASSASIPIPGATKVVAVSLNADWSGLRKTDLIIPYINGNKVSLLSNVNSFHNAGSLVGVDVLYY